jgi:hypothetical protein
MYPTKGEYLLTYDYQRTLCLLGAGGKGLLHGCKLGTDPLGVILNPLPLGMLPHVKGRVYHFRVEPLEWWHQSHGRGR